MNKDKLITRATYKNVKGMDRERMSAWISNVYLKGYEEGRKSVNNDALLRAFRSTLMSVDSIGPTRADAIMKKLADTFHVEQSNSTENSAESAQDETQESSQNADNGEGGNA